MCRLLNRLLERLMPKNILTIGGFTNVDTLSDPRDINDDTLSSSFNVMLSTPGVVTTMGDLASANYFSATSAGNYALRGLNIVKTDYVIPAPKVITSITDYSGSALVTSASHGYSSGDFVWVNSTETVYNGYSEIIKVSDDTFTLRYAYSVPATGYVVKVSSQPATGETLYFVESRDARIEVYSDTNKTSPIILTPDSTSGKTYYWVDGSMRVLNSTFSATDPQSKLWFGYVKNSFFDDANLDVDNWVTCNGFIAAPSRFAVYKLIDTTNGYFDTGQAGSTSSSFVGSADNKLGSGIAGGFHQLISTSKRENITTVASSTTLTTSNNYSSTSWQGLNAYIADTISGGICLGYNVTGGTGTWNFDATDIEFASSFIYDGVQESLLRTELASVLTKDVAATNAELIVTLAYTTTTYPTFSTATDARKTGARIYWRDVSSSFDWKLLLDADFTQGVRQSITDEFTPWATAMSSSYVYKATLTIPNPQTITYEALSGIQQTEPSINAEFKTAVLANRRMFAANVNQWDANGNSQVNGDRIIYTPVNKFDVFPYSHILDVGINDGDSFISLQAYADRLLAFKSETLYIINISQGDDTGWYLESVHSNMGVATKAMVVSTDFGVIWVNDNGCYIYDGNTITNLLSGIKQFGGTDTSLTGGHYSVATWESFITSNSMLGYYPKKNQIFIVSDATDGTAPVSNCYIFDFGTNTWNYGNKLYYTSSKLRNFVTSGTDMYTLVDNATTVTLYKWSDTPTLTASQYIITKDYTFNMPKNIKKVYGVKITYKSNNTVAYNGMLSYALNGSTTFVTTYIPTTTAAVATDWSTVTITFTQPLECESIKLKISGPTATDTVFSINDVAIQYRPIHRKV